MKTQDEVLGVIHTYFSREPIMGTSEMSSKQFIELLKPELLETWKKKDAYSDRWDAFSRIRATG